MTNNIISDCNLIEQVAVSELLDGRYFFIPSYQRGYRWTKTQVFDLCNDLLEYALKPKPNDRAKAFYSLQPLIVRKGEYSIAGEEKEAYEVIDGQQRLTTLYILFKYLMNYKNIKNPEELQKKRSKILYHLFYETRPSDFEVIEKLGFEELKNSDIKDIDIAHISNTYKFIDEWLFSKDSKNSALTTFKLYSEEDFSADAVTDKLFSLLFNKKDTKESEGNIQFLWYELGISKDAIREFLSVNKGKISLTDTEKIRALFMQRNEKGEMGSLKQLSIAKDWELIENTLHRKPFWSFISNEINKEDGRINIIFQYIFDNDAHENVEEEMPDYLFRYYYSKFKSKKNDHNKCVEEEWKKVMECFRMLQNWFYNPRVYNLIGLLVKEGLSLKNIADIYNESGDTTEQFITALNKKVREIIVDGILKKVNTNGNEELDVKGDCIELYYDNSEDKRKIPGLLRFLNVRVLCREIDYLLEEVSKPDEQKKASDMNRKDRDTMCNIYRFPFDALDSFGWDIEHIDSATTNSLNNFAERIAWIEEAEKKLKEQLDSNQEYQDNKQRLGIEATADEASKNLENIIKNIIGENEESGERKNWIGNLTYLDGGTNKSYKNKIFVWKRDVILDRIRRGVFVPVCTQNIFNKNYDGCQKDYLRWDLQDKKAYHNYILTELKKFQEQYK